MCCPHGRSTVGWLVGSRNAVKVEARPQRCGCFFLGGVSSLHLWMFIVGYLKMFNIGYFNIWGGVY